ncbi:uncharacterized protein BP5553_08040 [Venustampulla echinocandica]|uniref:Reverse transcriptase n=1 Tax=Venustampulla echinocandica TaxID=2656787 RepID=A0A370TFJ7_9HELO|nr:uncharacterized protein BP5553_08040 [Venustampulla echinocandica]RDL33672.1 hypothetical protein BP5553_08040 [Venustampulla echinocandica]
MDQPSFDRFVIKAHQLQALISERPNFRSHLSSEQLQAISHVTTNAARPDSTSPIIPPNWKNKYSNAVASAEAVHTQLPEFTAYRHQSEKSSSGASHEVSHTLVSRPCTPAVASTTPNPPIPQQRVNSASTSNIMAQSNPSQNQNVGNVGNVTMSPEQFQQFMNGLLARAPAAPVAPVGNGEDRFQDRFRPQDLGYFDPDNDAKPSESTDGKTTYHNVFSFTARVRVKSQNVTNGPWSSINLAAKLDQCLKGKAELWYTNEISATTRAGLKTGIDLWCSELETRFRDAPGAALEKLEASRYTIRDVRSRKDPEDFVQDIIVQAQNAGTALSERAQILTAYQHLDAQLRVTLPTPADNTRMTDFIKQLTAAKSNWFDIYRPFPQQPQQPSKMHFNWDRRQQTFQQNRPQFQSNSSYRPGFQSQRPIAQSQFSSQAQFQSSRPFSSQPQRQLSSLSSQSASRQPFPSSQYNPASRQTTEHTDTHIKEENTSGWHRQPPQRKTFNQPQRSGRSYNTQHQEASQEQEDTMPDPFDAVYFEDAEAYMDDPQPDESEHYPPDEISDPDAAAHFINPTYYAPTRPSHTGNAPQHLAIATRSPAVQSLQPLRKGVTTHIAPQPAIAEIAPIICVTCLQHFDSRNKLHEHIRTCHKNARSGARSPRVIPIRHPPAPIPSSPASSAPASSSMQAQDGSAQGEGQMHVVTSTAPPSLAEPGYAFRGRRYAQVMLKLGSPHNDPESACLDTGCGMSLIDRGFLRKYAPTAVIQTMPTPMTVRGIGDRQHNANQFTIIDFYLPTSTHIVAHFHREIHIVDDLDANVLLGLDIAVPEGWNIDLDAQVVTLPHCSGVKLPIITHAKGPASHTPIYTADVCKLQPHSRRMVKVSGHKGIPLEFPVARDLIYQPQQQDTVTTYAHLIDHTCSAVLVENNSEEIISLPANMLLGHVSDPDDVDAMSPIPEIETYHLAAVWPTKRSWAKLLCKGALASATATALYSAPALSSSQLAMHSTTRTEMILSNGVTVFGSSHQQPALQTLVSEFASLWDSNSSSTFAKTPHGEEMQLPLIDNWETKYKPGQARVYAVGREDRRVIDEVFDELHRQGRLRWTSESTPFTFPCFVVWKKSDAATPRKGRVVIDIRALNHITMPDAYPIPSQADILAAIAGCPYISTIDCASFFYQWKVKQSDQHKLTVASHRGQETFNCAVMGYRNSVAYVQRVMDTLLRQSRSFARTYIDDIVIFSRTFKDHLQHLRAVFTKLAAHSIHLSAKKSFLAYPSVQLLGQRVDALGLATDQEKLRAISHLCFPRSLKQLEYYLGLTGYLRQYIRGYAQLSQPLQLRKSDLYNALRAKGHVKGTKRKREAGKQPLPNPTQSEVNAFQNLQGAFATPHILHHFDPTQRLYTDLDASIQGFGAFVYHSTSDPPTQKSIRPILFLSRVLKSAETRYWPTELEIAGLCWTISKIRHMIEAASLPTIVYTDHGASLQIATQTSMNTTSLVRMNTRHVRASEYLSRFRLEIRYKPGRKNTVPDALSRLAQSPTSIPNNPQLRATHQARNLLSPPTSSSSDIPSSSPGFLSPSPAATPGNNSASPLARSQNSRQTSDFLPATSRPKSILSGSIVTMPPSQSSPATSRHIAAVSSGNSDIELAYPAVVVQISPEFLQRLRTEYIRDSRCVKLLEIIQQNNQLPEENRARLPFYTARGILYAKPDVLHHHRRPVVPKAMEHDIFDNAHDQLGHPGYDRVHERIAGNFYIFNASKRLREYLWHCHHCRVASTPRHQPFGALQPIISPPKLFHTISIDFILALPTSIDGYDAAMSVTEKFAKPVTIIPGKSTWTGAQWGWALIDRLLLLLWGMPSAIISDRDPKFLGELWQSIFLRMHTRLLFTTAYHPSADGASERSNQTIEIALRYYLTTLDDITKWPEVLPRLSAALSNSTSRGTGQPSTVVLYGSRIQEPLDVVARQLIDIGEDDIAPHEHDAEHQTAFPIEPATIANYRPSHIDAHDAIMLAAMTMKRQYDAHHKPMFFKPGEFVALRLHRGYCVPGLKERNIKIEQQFAGPFKIIERVGRLAYRIELPPTMKIHPVISIAHLEPAPNPADDPFMRPFSQTILQEPIAEKILRVRRLRRAHGSEFVQYLIRFQGLSAEYDRWMKSTDVSREMIMAFERALQN